MILTALDLSCQSRGPPEAVFLVVSELDGERRVNVEPRPGDPHFVFNAALRGQAELLSALLKDRSDRRQNFAAIPLPVGHQT